MDWPNVLEKVVIGQATLVAAALTGWIGKTVSDAFKQIGQNKKDIDEAFKKIRKLEGSSDERQ